MVGAWWSVVVHCTVSNCIARVIMTQFFKKRVFGKYDGGAPPGVDPVAQFDSTWSFWKNPIQRMYTVWHTVWIGFSYPNWFVRVSMGIFTHFCFFRLGRFWGENPPNSVLGISRHFRHFSILRHFCDFWTFSTFSTFLDFATFLRFLEFATFLQFLNIFDVWRFLNVYTQWYH